MKRALILTALLLCAPAYAADLRPERIVRNTTVSSQHDPPIHVSVPDTAVYVGADRWILYGIADCEIHLFVEADADKTVRHMYWIQFEASLPEKPEATHRYSDPILTLDDIAFFVRARFGPTSDTGRQGSDLEHVLKLLRDNGYKVPEEMMNVRLVFLPDELKRKELMIIYAEDLAPTGLTSAQLMKDGKIGEQWAPIEKDLIERARERITLVRMN